MWFCFNNAFLSIVQPPQSTSGDSPLLVRARRKGDIEKIFPGVQVRRTPGRDYLYRALIERRVVSEVIADQVASIEYGNFKDSVADDRLHSAYSRVWSIMSGLQEVPPYSTSRAAGRQRDLL